MWIIINPQQTTWEYKLYPFLWNLEGRQDRNTKTKKTKKILQYTTYTSNVYLYQ